MPFIVTKGNLIPMFLYLDICIFSHDLIFFFKSSINLTKYEFPLTSQSQAYSIQAQVVQAYMYPFFASSFQHLQVNVISCFGHPVFNQKSEGKNSCTCFLWLIFYFQQLIRDKLRTESYSSVILLLFYCMSKSQHFEPT